MKSLSMNIAFLLIAIQIGCTSSNQEETSNSPQVGSGVDSLPSCEWCGAKDAPSNPGWETTIAGPDEPGERLALGGTVYQPDGKTPAGNILIYAYHTNNEGVYAKQGDETGNGLRHGHLRGWARTNSQGKYLFHTIRPMPYPSRSEPAHIHMTVSAPDIEEYWLYSTLIEGDPLISDNNHTEDFRTGGPTNIIPFEMDTNGVWQGKRDIILRK